MRFDDRRLNSPQGEGSKGRTSAIDALLNSVDMRLTITRDHSQMSWDAKKWKDMNM
jgi:hypothetical protein